MNHAGLKILAVDDQPENLGLLNRVLEMAQFDVRAATSGQAALQAARADLPDLILMDISMPGMDGFEVCKKLKADPKTKDVPVVFLTGRSDTEHLVKGFELGAVDYITKPFNNSELLHRINTHLELSHLRKNLERQVSEQTNEILAANSEMEKSNRVYSSFVPREFLTQLGRDNILDVQLGDHVQTEMTILFADIVDFTSLSEKMGPQASFKFINAYLSWISPIIRMNNGFIDKYIGDAIMAIFPENADDALQTAVGMQQAMQRFNKQFVSAGIPPIRIGIGLHKGSLMLGVIGEAERMETTVISDAVNVAARLERLTRRYDVGIVVSENTLQSLAEDNNTYHTRLIDKVRVKGRSETTVVHEVYNGDSAEAIAQKQETSEEYEKGVELYYQRQFTEANLHIARVLSQTPNDKVVRLHQQRIAAAIANGVADDWTGVELLERK
jgi:class 3 adenylate cyclase